MGLSGAQVIYDRTHLPSGQAEALGAPFTQVLDARFFPELTDVDTAVANLLSALSAGTPPSALSLGPASLALQAEVTQLTFDVLFGLTPWLSVGGELPLVRARVFARPSLEASSAGAGRAATAFGGDPAAFFGQIDTALATLDTLITSGTLDPASQVEAEDLRARTGTYALGMESLSGRFTLLPTDSGNAGQSLRAVHDELTAKFDSFGITFPALDLADVVPTQEAFALLADSLAMPPFGDADSGYRLGDAAVKAFLQPVNTFRPVELGAAEPWFRYRAAAGIARRFATGSQDRPDRAYDLPTGRGSASTEGIAVLDLALRRRWWLTVQVSLVLQARHSLTRRVTPPDTPLAGGGREAEVVRDPGDLWLWTVVPRYSLNESVSLGLVYQREDRGRDRFAYAAAPLPGISADVLGEGSAVRATRWGFEVRYRSTGALGEARPARSIEAALSFLRTTSADGRAPATSLWRVGARLYP